MNAPEQTDRRKGERRRDKGTSRLLVRALAIQRVFGPETALTLLLTSGVDETLTRTVLAVRKERRKRKARALPGQPPSATGTRPD